MAKIYKPKIRMLTDILIIMPLLIILLFFNPLILDSAFTSTEILPLDILVPYLFLFPYIFLIWLAYKIIFVLRLEYEINEGGNLIKTRGVIGRFRQDLPFKRITNIHKNRSWWYRLLGLTEVQIQTAGSSGIEMTLGGLSYDDGEEIYIQLEKFKGTGDAT